jgi:NMD protein affecting ribosome stability and mRNA decay
VSSEALCEKCLVEGVVIDTGTASGRKHYRCQECGATWRGKNAAAVTMGRLGGQARANNISKDRAEAIATDAANARWRKEKQA